MYTRRWPNRSTAVRRCTQSNRHMQNRTKLVLMNLAVAAALIYRWRTGTPIVPLVITAVIMFTLVNVLLLFAAKKSSSSR